MKTCNQRKQVCWQCGRVFQWLQSQSRSFLWFSCGMRMFLLRATVKDKTWLGPKRISKLGCLFRASLSSASNMAVFSRLPWQVLCHTILLETQNLTHAAHLHLGSLCARLRPLTSAFSLFSLFFCNPQPKSSRQLLPSYWESLKSHLCFAWWKETCVMTDWFGVSLLSLTLDNLDSSSVLSSAWPAGSWSMWWQLVVSEESSLLVLNLCQVVNPEAATCGERLVWCQFAFLDGGEPRQLFGVVQCLTCRVLEYEGGGGCERRNFTSLGAKLVSCSQSRSLRLWWKIGLVSVAGFRMGRAAKNEPHQHVANWRALPSVERLGMNSTIKGNRCAGSVVEWFSDFSRNLLDSFCRPIESHWSHTFVLLDEKKPVWWQIGLVSVCFP